MAKTIKSSKSMSVLAVLGDDRIRFSITDQGHRLAVQSDVQDVRFSFMVENWLRSRGGESGVDRLNRFIEAVKPMESAHEFYCFLKSKASKPKPAVWPRGFASKKATTATKVSAK